jgi:streptogramin lyase
MKVTLDAKVRTQSGHVGSVWVMDKGWALVRVGSRLGEFTTWEHVRDLKVAA